MISVVHATKMTAYNRWMNERLYGLCAGLTDVEREATDAGIARWASTLAAAELATELRYTTMVNPQPKSCPLWLAVTHFFNHQTHHRGQLTTLLAQKGIDPGVTDLLWLPDPR